MDFPRLETERLVLRQVTKQDAPDLFRFLSDDEVMRYVGDETFTSMQQVMQVIALSGLMFQEKDSLRFGIALQGTDRLIGTCGFHSWEPSQHRAELFGLLAKEHWNCGYMTEALRRVVRYGFEEMDLYRIQCKVEPPNLASSRMVENLGFREEGTLRAFGFVNGEFRDKILYSRLKTDNAIEKGC